MKKTKYLIAFVIMLSSNYLTADISFRNYTLDKAKGVAKFEQRNIIVNYSADWCLPCKLLHQGAYKDAKLTRFMNSEFVNIEAHYENQEQKEWFDEYKVKDLPVILILNHRGEELYRLTGLMTAEILYNTFQQFIDGGRPLKIIDYKKKYKEKYKIYSLEETRKNAQSSNQGAALISNETILKPEKTLLIQFGRFKKYKKAKKRLKNLKEKNIDAMIVERLIKDNLSYSIVLDRPVSFEESAELCNGYIGQGISCYLQYLENQ